MVSIIIPTYNRATKIAGAIESVIAQTGVQTQIIVIDDGSTDGTREVVSRYPQVEYHWQENRRQAAARNHGLSHARGQFIASLDSDDRWEPDFLSTSLACMEEQGTDFVFSNYRVVSNGKVRCEQAFSELPYLCALITAGSQATALSVDQTRQLFVQHNPSPNSALLMTRHMIHQGWDEDTYLDDWFLVLDAVLIRNVRATMQFRPLWTKHQGDDNINDVQTVTDSYRVTMREIHDYKRLLQRHVGTLTAEEKGQIRQKTARSYSDAAYIAALSGHLGNALKHQWSSVQLMPSVPQTLRFFKLSFTALFRRKLG